MNISDKLAADPALRAKVAKYVILGMMTLAVAEVGLVAYLWSKMPK